MPSIMGLGPVTQSIMIFLLVGCVVIPQVSSHGRIVNPAGRGSSWRYGYDTPVDYDDHQLYCGGKTVQHEQNGGKCGICGDPFNGVREHEYPGGKYTQPLRITGHYASGSIMDVVIELTVTHLGYFIFRICPETSDVKEVSQECLDKRVMKVLNQDDNEDKYYVRDGRSHGFYNVSLRLPQDMTCDRCLFQWTYTAGNSWGRCEDGRSDMGCGPQETFRGCSDVKVYPRGLISLKKVHEFEV